jgi:release factor glutamine methyltransferase
MDWQAAQKELVSRLSPLYEEREAAVITDWVMEHLSGWKKLDRLLHKTEQLSPKALEQLQQYTRELLTNRPVQYVLQESWFEGMKFFVDERVLIPRPETEELVEWVVAEVQSAAPLRGAASASAPAGNVLDVGTGSGCIAISLKKRLAALNVFACDISPDALAVARQNAATLGATIHFQQLDFRDSGQWSALPEVRYLVSNPPYIPMADKSSMPPHVLGFEPHLALFVEDHDPLIFYRSLAAFAAKRLSHGGALFAEIHEDLAEPIITLFGQNGFPNTTLKKDMQGKQRLIKATR